MRIMYRSSRWLLVMGTCVLLAPGAVAAHPVSDLEASSEVYFANGWARLDDKSGAMTDHLVAKSPGTLDLTLDLQALGIDHDGALYLTGTRHGQEVWWDFDQTLEVTLDDFNWTRRVEGRLVARVEQVPAMATPTCMGGPCPYSLHLEARPADSWVRLHGTTSPFFEWTRDIEVDFEMYSGWLRPQLHSLTFETPGGLCVRHEDRVFTGRITLTDPAPGEGSVVQLTSDDPTILRSNIVRVPPGDRSTTFSVPIPGGYEGRVEITASAAGLQSSETLDVNPEQFCIIEQFRFDLDDIEAEFGCRGCVGDLQLGAGGSALAELFEEKWLRDPEGYWLPLNKYIGEKVHHSRLSDYGDLVGMLGETEGLAYHLSGASLEEPIIKIPGFRPVGFDRRGMAFGSFLSEKLGTVPGYFAAGYAVPLDLGMPNATLVGASNAGFAFGHVDDGEARKAFLAWNNGEVKWIELDGQRVELVDANAAGDVVGTLSLDEHDIAFVVPAGKGKPILIEDPQGRSTRAVGIDEAGVVVVNYFAGENEPVGAALYSHETHLIPLGEVLGKLGEFVTVSEVLDVDGAFDLAVRGKIDGEPATFGLRNVGPKEKK